MSRRPSPAAPQRRAVALKRLDGEPLTRADIQYDVLHHIFHDAHNVFTDPYPSNATPTAKVCFRDLYVKAILNSPKATKALKDKMTDSHIFAEDFAMLALLVNVGRVNTTMSFFPEMKTAIRTYHPIPALQRTAGNLQDAPRIKHILKSSVLKNDSAVMPSTPSDILSRVKTGHIPSTTIMNLIFVLSNHSAPIGRSHFSEGLDFIDLFIRDNVSSFSRARAFLWLCYHYLEAPVMDNDDDYDNDGPSNPFADSRRGQTLAFTFLSESEVAQENVDPEDEKALAERLVAQRAEILRTQGAKETNKAHGKIIAESIGDDEEEYFHANSDIKSKGKGGPAKEKKAKLAALRNLRVNEEGARKRGVRTPPMFESDDEYGNLIPQSAYIIAQNRYPHYQCCHQPQRFGGRLRTGTPEPSGICCEHRHHRYSPYSKNPVLAAYIPKQQHRLLSLQVLSSPPRSLLQQAYHIVTTTDPLIDSDDEDGDQHIRDDYIQRLQVINIIRHKEPTPEFEHDHTKPNAN